VTLEQLIVARDNALLVKANALAALAGGESAGVPGGKPNTSGSNTVDHMGLLSQMDAEIDKLNQEIIRVTGAAGVTVSYDC
jgi:hypothetical protein